jgi:hypothetical protein
MPAKVYAPNVHFFAFSLLGNGQNQDWLWSQAEKVVKHSSSTDLHLMRDWLDLNKEPDNPRIDVIKAAKAKQGNTVVPITGKVSLSQQKSLAVNGFIYPIRIYDSYGIWLNIHRPEQENHQKTEPVEIDFFQKLNPTNDWLLPVEKDFLGSSLLLTAWLTPDFHADNPQELKKLADDCVQTFFANTNNTIVPPFYRSGELFGSPIFEYGLLNPITNYRHVLVWLFKDEMADKSFNNCQQELFDLCFFRTKIVKAFQKTRSLYKETATAYQELEAEVESLQKIDINNSLDKQSLETLKNKLKILPQKSLEYASLLRFLEDYQNTIAINAANYQDRLEQIHSLCPDTDLTILEQFSQVNSPLFEKQISSDLGYFRHGSGLVDKAIASIRGIVEIEQARLTRQQADIAETALSQRQAAEKDLQNAITAIGTGIAAGSFVASSSGLITAPWAMPFANNASPYPHPFLISLVISTLIALGAWRWVKWFVN